MQEKTVKTWNDNTLLLCWFGVEVIVFLITRSNPPLCFVATVVGFPLWAYIASLFCEYVPCLRQTPFKLYFSKTLPEHRIYHVLKADEDGYILFRETDAMIVSCWCIDHPIGSRKVKEIWDEL